MNEENGKRVYLQIYDYETKEFSGLTTYHGLVRIYNSNTWPSRIFWSVVVLSCLSLFMIHSGYLLLGYHAKPTLFQINTIVPDDGVIFPEVTICNLNPINFHKAKKFNISGPALSYLMDFNIDINQAQVKDYTTEKKAYDTFVYQYTKNTGKKFNSWSFLKEISKTCEESVIGCSFSKNDFDNCCARAVTEFTDHGICFRFTNEGNNLRQWYSGDGFGWEFVLNGNNEDNDYDDYISDHGFLVSVHEKGKYPKIESNSVAISHGETIHAAIHMKNISLLTKENWGVCQNTWADKDIELQYTAQHCENICYLERAVKTCGCSPLALLARQSNRDDMELCEPQRMFSCLQEIRSSYHNSCSCESECDLLEYDLSTSYSEVSSRTLKKFGLTRQYIEKHISVASVFLRQVAYERHEQQKQLQTADLLSNIAGSMGLFLGMSTVTLLEIFIYLFKSVWGTVNSARQRQFMEAVAEEERERQQSLVIIQDSNPDEEEFVEEVVAKQPAREERKHSTTPIHIHLDRRNSRMLRGGDLFSAPRGSVSIPSQLLSPLSKHRKSISVGALGRKNSMQPVAISETLGTSSSDEVMEPKKSQIRRCSTLSPPTFHRGKRDSTVSQADLPTSSMQLGRKTSTHSVFRSQLL